METGPIRRGFFKLWFTWLSFVRYCSDRMSENDWRRFCNSEALKILEQLICPFWLICRHDCKTHMTRISCTAIRAWRPARELVWARVSRPATTRNRPNHSQGSAFVRTSVACQYWVQHVTYSRSRLMIKTTCTRKINTQSPQRQIIMPSQCLT